MAQAIWLTSSVKLMRTGGGGKKDSCPIPIVEMKHPLLVRESRDCTQEEIDQGERGVLGQLGFPAPPDRIARRSPGHSGLAPCSRAAGHRRPPSSRAPSNFRYAASSQLSEAAAHASRILNVGSSGKRISAARGCSRASGHCRRGSRSVPRHAVRTVMGQDQFDREAEVLDRPDHRLGEQALGILLIGRGIALIGPAAARANPLFTPSRTSFIATSLSRDRAHSMSPFQRRMVPP